MKQELLKALKAIIKEINWQTKSTDFGERSSALDNLAWIRDRLARHDYSDLQRLAETYGYKF